MAFILWPVVPCFVILAAASSAVAQTIPGGPGLTVRDGKLYREGKVCRGIGVNYCDLFQELIHDPGEQRTLDGLWFLGSKGIPFVRFWCCGF